jgi:hypothetical protein
LSPRPLAAETGQSRGCYRISRPKCTYLTFFVLVLRTVAQTVVLAKTDHVVFICIIVDIIFQNNAWWHLTFIEDNIIYMQALSKMLDR